MGSDCCGERQGQEITKLLSWQARNQRLREDLHTELVREVFPLSYKVDGTVQRKEMILVIRPDTWRRSQFDAASRTSDHVPPL